MSIKHVKFCRFQGTNSVIPTRFTTSVPNMVGFVVLYIVISVIGMQTAFGEHVGTPLNQTRHNVLADQVKCVAGLVKVYKASNLMPACVTHASVQVLIARGWAISIDQTAGANSTRSHERDYAMIFLVNSASLQYNTTLANIIKHLKNGDYLMISGYRGSSDIRQDVEKVRSLVDKGVNVGAIRIYNNIDMLTGSVPNLPKGFDYIGYDYEQGAGFSPEFTTNETTSIGYFDKAKAAVAQYNQRTESSAKFLIMPPYGELGKTSWDWGRAASHADMIDIQFQAFIKDDRFLSYVLDAISQIKQEAPSAKVFAQMSLVPKRGTAQDNLDSIDMIKKLPIDGFFMFYHPNQTQELDQFLKIVPK